MQPSTGFLFDYLGHLTVTAGFTEGIKVFCYVGPPKPLSGVFQGFPGSQVAYSFVRGIYHNASNTSSVCESFGYTHYLLLDSVHSPEEIIDLFKSIMSVDIVPDLLEEHVGRV